MEYFKEPIPFQSLKHWFFKDPLCDWLEVHSHRFQTYQPSQPSKYKDYIEKVSSEYKQKVMNTLCEKLGLPMIYPTLSVSQTRECFKNKESFIMNGTFVNEKLGTTAKCDVCIHYELFQTIFPEIQNQPEASPEDYVLFQICFSTLAFKKNKQEVISDEYLRYRQAQLVCIQQCISEYTDHKVHLCLLGKEYSMNGSIVPKHTRIAHIIETEPYVQTMKEGLHWIRDLRKNYTTMQVLPEPNHPCLYPNMNYKQSSWEHEKQKLAGILKEITLVWNVSYKERCQLLKQNIHSWDHPRFISYLKESKQRRIQERMIHMNQQTEVLMYPRKTVSKSFQDILKLKENVFYWDIESFLSFEEKQDFVSGQWKGETPIIAIIGMIHNQTFSHYTIQKFTKKDELNIIDSWYHSFKGDTVYLFHWGHAEKYYLSYMKQCFPEYNWNKFQCIDILQYFKQEPILVQGAFSFGLKTIGNLLYQHGFIQTQWEDYDNGLDTMIEFKEICIQHTKQIPLQRDTRIKKIIHYNQVDCQVLKEIVDCLRSRFL